jgi:hypothetical protein
MSNARARPRGPALGCGGVALILLAAVAAPRGAAQLPDTSQAAIAPTGVVVVAPDTTHGIAPMGAFWRSLLLPGWGQARTGRPVAGAVFASWEGVTAMMTLKAESELRYLRQSGSDNVHPKRQEAQDWLVLWIFNHLFAGAEAFVSAHLQDFPKDLKLRAIPGGVGLSMPLPLP